MPDFLKIIILFLLIIALVIYLNRKKSVFEFERKFKIYLGDRTRIDANKLYETYNNKDFIEKDIFVGVFECLEKELDKSFKGYLRIDDSFKKNLSFIFEEDEWLDIALLENVENHFKVQFNDFEVKNMESIKDIILAVKIKLDKYSTNVVS